MSGFQLDTSGAVEGVPAVRGPNAPGALETRYHGHVEWRYLDPFTQGYIEALFASGVSLDDGALIPRVPLGFRDLAPEALALILKDCAGAAQIAGTASRLEDGATFWRLRQQGWQGFPPLVVALNDAGKVVLS